MVQRGHRLQALLHEYPMDLVFNLHRAATANRQDELKSEVLGFIIAVTHAIDLTFGGGKGKVLEGWLAAMDGPGDGGEEGPKRTISVSPATRAFFAGAPVIKKKDSHG